MGHKRNLTGQLVAITGGSAGLGLSLAIEYVQRDANVLITARNEDRLAAALLILERHRQSTTQMFRSVSVDCMDASRLSEALLSYGVPDVLIACAGHCLPRLFVDLDASDFDCQMRENYSSAVNAILPVYRALLHKSRRIDMSRRRTRIVLVSSTAAFLGLTGYSAYAPSKAALRSLADHLRQETLLYKTLRKSLRIHCVFPSTMTSPSFLNEEQVIKPEVTKVLESSDVGRSTDDVARRVMRQLDKDQFLISPDFLGSLVKGAMMGPSPNSLLQSWKSLAGSIAMTFYVPLIWDRQVRKFGDSQDKKIYKHSRGSSREDLLEQDEARFVLLHRSTSMTDDTKFSKNTLLLDNDSKLV